MGTTTTQTHRTEKEGDSQPEPLAEEIFLPGSGKVRADFCSVEDVTLVLRWMPVDFLSHGRLPNLTL